MAIPQKVKPAESGFKGYILYKGGWKRLIKVSLGLGVFAVLYMKGTEIYKDIKRQKLYSEGEMLVRAGKKGTEMEMYFNEDRKPDEFLKPRIDTTEKVTFGGSFIKK